MSWSRSILRPYSRCNPATGGGGGSGASCSSTSTNGANSGFANCLAASCSASPVGGAATMMTASKPGCGEFVVQGLVLAQPVLEDGGGGPLDLDVLSDQQPVLGPIRDHQQTQAQDPGARAARSAALQNSNGLESTTGTLATQLFGFVGSLSLQALQVLGSHVARDVFARKA